ncbi:peptide ABC transporter substrate-binding protein [Desulfosporosinus fructosivorans]|nr:peptide ABC transporter substrate-binding protein [Desulfosporosinus fructosivorans]
MFKIRKKRSLSVAIAMVLAVSVLLTGCGGSKQPDASAKVMKASYNAGAEPETLDPAISTGVPESHIQTALFEGLTRKGEGEKVMPGIAESWTTSTDGTVITFKLRDAKWSNGDAITAEDFKYSWLRALAPATASEYAYQLYYIKGAEDYNSQKGTADAVAIKVVDPKTLEVTLAAPTPYFVALTAFHTLYPVNKKAVEASKEWSLKAETFVSNGPFKMQEWKHNDQVIVVKNENYWDAKNVKMSEVTFKLLEDIKAALTAFESGQIDGSEYIPIEDIDRLKAAKVLRIDPYIGTSFYRFNVTKKPFNDVKVRKALAMAIDRKMLIDKVVKGGQLPAYAYTPPGMVDVEEGKDFRVVGGDYIKEDVAAAKALLAEAGYPEGKNWPADVSILYNTKSDNKLMAEAIQNMWKTNLGIDVKLRNEEWAVYLESQKTINYNISRAAWIGDYADAMTFMDMFVTGGGNNQTGWSNPEYDKQIKEIANKSGDQKVRVAAMHAAEKVLMDEMPIMPIYFYTLPWVMKDNIKGVFRSSLGPIDFKLATVE